MYIYILEIHNRRQGYLTPKPLIFTKTVSLADRWLVHHVLEHGLQECPHVHCLLRLLGCRIVFWRRQPPPCYTTFSSLNLYHVPYLRPCYENQQCLPNIIQDHLKCFNGWHLTIYTKCDWHPIKSLVCCHTSYPH